MAEMVRRWLWVFVRVEWEVVKTTSRGRKTRRAGNGDGLEYEGEEFELQARADDG
jgi:hypothetical protein